MSESSPTPLTNTKFEIDEVEAGRRLDELEPIFYLSHVYSRVKRITKMPDGSYETDGDHVLQLQLVTLCYIKKYHPEIDVGRMAIYLLVHDIVEAIVGDTSTLGSDETALIAKDGREALGIPELREFFRPFPEVMGYIDDYEHLRDREAAFGKGMDKLMPGYAHARDGGATIKEHGISSYEEAMAPTATDARLAVYAEAFQDVIMMRWVQKQRLAQIAFGKVADERGTIS